MLWQSATGLIQLRTQLCATAAVCKQLSCVALLACLGTRQAAPPSVSFTLWRLLQLLLASLTTQDATCQPDSKPL